MPVTAACEIRQFRGNVLANQGAHESAAVARHPHLRRVVVAGVLRSAGDRVVFGDWRYLAGQRCQLGRARDARQSLDELAGLALAELPHRVQVVQPEQSRARSQATATITPQATKPLEVLMQRAELRDRRRAGGQLGAPLLKVHASSSTGTAGDARTLK